MVEGFEGRQRCLKELKDELNGDGKVFKCNKKLCIKCHNKGDDIGNDYILKGDVQT